MKKVVLTVAFLMMFANASACIADIGTASTNVYVRSVETGDIVGSLEKGDKVIVTGNAGRGYKRVEIGGKEYKVYGDYLSISPECADETEVTTKPKKSKSASAKPDSNGVKGKRKKKKIKGSDFEGMCFW